MRQIFITEMKCSFVLREPNSDKPTRIYMYARVNHQQCRLATGVKVYPAHWSPKRQEALVSHVLTELENQNNKIVNERIHHLRHAFMDFKHQLCENPQLIGQAISLLKSYIYQKEGSHFDKKNAVVNVFSKLIHDSRKSNSTKDAYYFRLRVFEMFLRQIGKPLLSIHELDKQLIRQFGHYLFNERELCTNTHNQYIKFIFARLNEAEEAEYITREERFHNGIDKIYRLPKVEDNSWNRPALTEEQIEQLYQCKGLKEREEEVRDLFVLNCNIGQRFNDFIKKVNRDTIHVNENGIEVLELIQDKCNHRVIVPITPQAKEILMKYDYQLPKYTPTQANYYLNRIAQKAGLTDLVQILSEEHSDYKPVLVPLYSLISTHTARRTFATRCYYKWGIDILTLSKLLGHSSVQQTEEYIKITSVQAADKAASKMLE
jgi:integrase